MKHNGQLFEALITRAQAIDPAVRAGSTFGWPGAYLGPRLVACVFGDRLAMKVPEDVGTAAVVSGQCRRFRPHGMPTSPQWIEVAADDKFDAAVVSLLRETVRFAQSSSDMGRSQLSGTGSLG